jgi:hypothetical protein
MSTEYTSKQSQTDWQRLDAMTDEEIDLSDCPEIIPEQFVKAVVRKGLPVTKNKAQCWSGLSLNDVVIRPKSRRY